MRKFLKWQSICLLGLTTNAFAAHYLPVFTGNWYTKADVSYEDTCSKMLWSYTNWYQGSDKSYAELLLSDPPAHANCTWGEVTLDQTVSSDYFEPTDFIGTSEDWQTISAQPKATIREAWYKECKDANGSKIATVIADIIPSYVCPVGSRFGFEEGTMAMGCTDLPLACSADVVGRDLASVSSSSIDEHSNLSVTDETVAGHVGLTMMMGINYSSVLEVLGDPEGIFVNKLDDFKNKSKYWGEKYDLPTIPKLSSTQGLNILNKGFEQMQYPFEYTMSWDWHPGSATLHKVYSEKSQQWQDIYSVSQGALFRCDSFVYYSYLAGANAEIVTGGFLPPTNPETIYTAFSNIRFPSSAAYIAKWSGKVISTKNYSTDLNMKDKLDLVFSSNKFDENLANLSTYQFVHDKEIPTDDKTKFLLGLLNKYQYDYDKFAILLDSISVLKPVGVVQSLVDIAKTQGNKAKKRILFAIVDIINSSSSESISNLNNKVPDVIAAQHYFQSILSQETDEYILNTAISLFPSITPPEQAKLWVSNAKERLAIKEPVSYAKVNRDNVLNLRLAFETEYTQINDLPSLLTRAGQGDSVLLANTCFILQSMPPEALSDQVRPLLKNLLLDHKDYFKDLAGEIRGNYQDYPPCNWLSAYATVMTEKEADRDTYILSYIKSLSNSLEKASYLKQQDWSTLYSLSGIDKTYYREMFQKKLKESTAQKETKQYWDALSALKDNQ